MNKPVFNAFWYGPSLPPMHWACLDSFIRQGHTLRVFGYQALDLPDGVVLEDANQVVPESQLFEFEDSFSAFSNIFRYKLLLEQGGWWVDTDVYCHSSSIPDCDYAWAWQDEDSINGAILKFPAGDPTLAGLLKAAEAIGNRIEVWGEMGPQLLTEHLADGTFSGHYGTTRDFYAIHWLETHMFWQPGALDELQERTRNAPFIHLWGSCFKAFGIDPRERPPSGSFLHHIYGEAGVLDQLPDAEPAAQASVQASIGRHLARPWVKKRALRVLGYEVPAFREPGPDADQAESPADVAVVIPCYNMAWCVGRAVHSCFEQTIQPREVIVVDDGSTDESKSVIENLCRSHDRLRCIHLDHNVGHLGALKAGIAASTSRWTALLDADDELVSDSLERRVDAAVAYQSANGEWPELVYGDLYWEKIGPRRIDHFKRISGRDRKHLLKELCLCQTSTMMLGARAIHSFPDITNPYNTDDELVLAIAERHPILHCGGSVTITHEHDSPTRMSNSALRRLKGIKQLVRDHRGDILNEHGAGRLALWYLRVLRVAIEWHMESTRPEPAGEPAPSARPWWPRTAYHGMLLRLHSGLGRFLEKHFEYLYF